MHVGDRSEWDEFGYGTCEYRVCAYAQLHNQDAVFFKNSEIKDKVNFTVLNVPQPARALATVMEQQVNRCCCCCS